MTTERLRATTTRHSCGSWDRSLGDRLTGRNDLHLFAALQYEKLGRAFALPQMTRVITEAAGRLTGAQSEDGTATVAEEEVQGKAGPPARPGRPRAEASGCSGRAGQYSPSGPFHAWELWESMLGQIPCRDLRGTVQHRPAF